jgi:TPR repeat protein
MILILILILIEFLFLPSLFCAHRASAIREWDDAEALRWYKLSAAQGCVRALTCVALYHENGRTVVADKVKATRLFKRAAAAGDEQAVAQGYLGATHKELKRRLSRAYSHLYFIVTRLAVNRAAAATAPQRPSAAETNAIGSASGAST